MIGAEIAAWGLYTIIGRRLDVPAIAGHRRAGGDCDRDPGAVRARPGTCAFRTRRPRVGHWRTLPCSRTWAPSSSGKLALKSTPPGTAGSSLNLMVVFTATITVALGTPLSFAQVVGGLMVIGGRPADRRQGPAQARGAGSPGASVRAGPVVPARGLPLQGSAKSGSRSLRSGRPDPGAALSDRALPCFLSSSMSSASTRPQVDPQSGGSPDEEGTVHGADHVGVARRRGDELGSSTATDPRRRRRPGSSPVPPGSPRKGPAPAVPPAASGAACPPAAASARPDAPAASSPADRPLARAAESRASRGDPPSAPWLPRSRTPAVRRRDRSDVRGRRPPPRPWRPGTTWPAGRNPDPPGPRNLRNSTASSPSLTSRSRWNDAALRARPTALAASSRPTASAAEATKSNSLLRVSSPQGRDRREPVVPRKFCSCPQNISKNKNRCLIDPGVA